MIVQGERLSLSCAGGNFSHLVSVYGRGYVGGIFISYSWPREAKRTHCGSAGGTVDQNWTKVLTSEAVWSTGGVKIGEATRNGNLRLTASLE
jgi:hypothetical protein